MVFHNFLKMSQGLLASIVASSALVHQGILELGAIQVDIILAVSKIYLPT